MSEQIQAIIDRARALLTAATPGPWEVCPDLRPDIRSQSGTGGFLGCGHIATVSRYDANESDAALIAAAPELLAVLCDALDRAQFAAEWWAEERTIEIEALREAWAVMDSMARAAGVVGAFLEQAAPLLRPDVSGNVKAPNHVTVAFTDRVQSYEVTIRREGGKTPAETIGELTARAESAERRVEEADDLHRSIKAKVGQTPGDGLMVHDAIDALVRRAEEAEARDAHNRAEVERVDGGSPRCDACGGNGAVIVDGVTVAHALTVAEVQRESYDTARAKGWHEEDDQPPSEAMMRIAAEGLYQSARCRFIEAYRRGERGVDALAGVDPMGTMATLSDRQVRVIAWMALVNTEVAEAIEDVVAGRWGTTKNEKGKPDGLGSELADIVIRVCDSAGALGIDMEAELRAKLAFNRTRSHKHGGKLA